MKTEIFNSIPRKPEQPGLYDRQSEVDAYENEMGSGIVAMIEKKFVKSINQRYAHLSNINVLDLGCGPAWITTMIAEQNPTWQVTGIDASQFMLDKANARAKEKGLSIHWINVNVENTNLQTESYDLVVCHFAFSEFNNANKVISEVNRILKKGGIFIIQDLLRPPVWQFPILKFWRHLTNPGGEINQQYFDSLKGAYTTAELSDLFTPSGFDYEISSFMKFAGGIVKINATKQ